MEKEKFLKVFMVVSILFMLMPVMAMAEKIPVAILRTNADGKTKTLTFTYAERPKVFAKRGQNGIHRLNVGMFKAKAETYKGFSIVEDTPTWIDLTAPDGSSNVNNDKITTVKFDESFAKARPTSTFEWFLGLHKLKTIIGIENLNTSDVKAMDLMFEECSSLTKLNLSGFSFSKVGEKDDVLGVNGAIFKLSSCTNLTNLNVGNNDFTSLNSGLNMGNIFKEVGTFDEPCQLIVGQNFNKSVLGVKHDNGKGGFYRWLGGYFTLEATESSSSDTSY